MEKVRFPMMPPRDLFSLQFNLSLYWSHEALLQKKKILQALGSTPCPSSCWLSTGA